uniref:Protein CASC3 n=1 Tax=Culicoides sonorensis TaxID=179676 RepID=A0A336K2D1_CULSO
MTEKVAKYTSESDEESENKPKFQSPEKLKDGNNSQATLTTTVSAESDEYDTASEESGSGEYSEESETEEEENQENEDGSVVLDVERQSGDGQETDAENKKKVDDDEDRSNPQYIPKKGTFYEHDDRTAEDADAEVEAVEEGEDGGDDASTKAGKEGKEPKDAKPTRKWQASQDRWTHDRFEESEQAPKSKNELVSAYGYDIRSEDGPPKARRRRRYGKGPNKYTRNWEDEAAYAKQTQQRKPRPEDFPALGTEKRVSDKRSRHRNSDRQSSEYKENNDRNIERNEEKRSHSGRDDRDNNRDQRRNYKDNKSGGGGSNNRRNQNNQRNSQNHRNENYRSSGQNTLEFINQNRNKGNEPQKEEISQRFSQQQNQIQKQREPQQQQHNSNYHAQVHNVGQHHQQQSQHYQQPNHQTNNIIDNVHKDSSGLSFANSRLNNQRYQNENLDDNRYHQQQLQQQQQHQHISNKDQRDMRQTTPIAQNQPQVIQPTPQQLQNYVQMQAAVQQQAQQQSVQQANIQQQQKVNVQQLQQMSHVQAQVQQNQGQSGQDQSRTKRYSSLRQRTGMENIPQSSQGQQQGQQMIPDQSNIMSEAVILQQLQQNEKLTQMQSNALAHQKQISYHQAITGNQAPQAPQALPLQNATGPQYPPQYYAQSGPEYQATPVQQTTTVQTQPQPQMIAAAPQNASAQYQFAPQNTPSYIQNAYIPQQPGPVPTQPPPQMYVPSIQQAPAPQAPQFQPQYSGYTPNFTPQPTTNPQTTPIYQSQAPPSITYFAPTATNPPPTRVTRRPTNAIPILAPPERSGGNGNTKRNEFDNSDKMSSDNKQQQSAVGSAENIDHILDNMFVRRPPLQQTQMIKSTSPSIDAAGVVDSVKNLTIKDDSKDDKQQITTGTSEKVG